MIRNTTLHTLAQYCLYTARCAFAALIVVQRCEVIDLVAKAPSEASWQLTIFARPSKLS